MRGVVRLWTKELESYSRMIWQVITNPAGGPQWWPDDMHQAVRVSTSPEDKKLVASALTTEQWDQIVLVEDAILVIDNARLFARRSLELGSDELGPPLTPLERKIFTESAPKFELAVRALQSVIAAEEVESPVETQAARQDEPA